MVSPALITAPSFTIFGPTIEVYPDTPAPVSALAGNDVAQGKPSAPISLKVRSRKGLWLLALLALHANHPTSREWVAAALWPESENPRDNLRRTLTDARGALGDYGDVVEATGDTVCLRVPEGHVDVLKFDSLVKHEDLPSLEAAIALYSGPLLENCDEPWILLERERRASSYVLALERAARMHREAHRLNEAIWRLRLAVAASPLREPVYRDLMQALVDNGEAPEAILTYRRLRMLLRQELQTEPSADIVSLFQRIRAATRSAQSAGASDPAGAAASPVSAGEADKPSATDAIANVNGMEPHPGSSSLPRPLTSLLGRDIELGELTGALTQFRLVTIAGAGGNGKTRLAIEAASRLLTEFPDGIWFIDLAPITGFDLVVATMASVLDVQEARGQDLLQQVLARLREGRHLVILDNCEHVIDGCASIAREIANRCPSVHLLATSRRPLQLTGEVVQRLQPLNVPYVPSLNVDLDAASAKLLQESAAVQLFVERARAVQPAFSLSSRTLVTVAGICRRLDGIPLALELAAARAAALSVEQISNLLSNRFRLLSRGDRAARPRQQSLRALVDWSYDLLEPEEQALFARLSIFAGGWNLDAAVAVCGARKATQTADLDEAARWDMMESMDVLVESSLVLMEQDTEGGTRYRMLETIREYAVEKLKDLGGYDESRCRHMAWFLQFAEDARNDMSGEEQAQTLRRLDREYDNMRQALQQSEGGLDRMRLATALYSFWYIRGYYTEGRLWLEGVLAETLNAPISLRSRALRGAGNLCWVQGDLACANKLHLQNLEINRLEGNESDLGHTLNNLGLVALHQGELTKAADYYRQSIDVLRRSGDRLLLGPILGNLAIALKNLGDFDEAAMVLKEALEVARDAGDLRARVQALQVLSTLAVKKHDYATARGYTVEALEVNLEIGDALSTAISEHGLAEIAFAEGDLETAETYLKKSLERVRVIGAKRSIAASLATLGDVAFAAGKFAEARDYHRDSMRMEMEVDNRSGIGDSLLTIALIEVRNGCFELATRLMGAVEADTARTGWPLEPKRQDEIKSALETARDVCGEQLITAAWNEGVTTDLKEAAAQWLSG